MTFKPNISLTFRQKYLLCKTNTVFDQKHRPKDGEVLI